MKHFEYGLGPAWAQEDAVNYCTASYLLLRRSEAGAWQVFWPRMCCLFTIAECKH